MWFSFMQDLFPINSDFVSDRKTDIAAQHLSSGQPGLIFAAQAGSPEHAS
jgi:hypothetical protein